MPAVGGAVLAVGGAVPMKAGLCPCGQGPKLACFLMGTAGCSSLASTSGGLSAQTPSQKGCIRVWEGRGQVTHRPVLPAGHLAGPPLSRASVRSCQC